jgi:hypothetical protein
VNANQLHRWVRHSREDEAVAKANSSLPRQAPLASIAPTQLLAVSVVDTVPPAASVIEPGVASATSHSSLPSLPTTRASKRNGDAVPRRTPQASIAIEVNGARIVLDGSVDRGALAVVLDCLRHRVS